MAAKAGHEVGDLRDRDRASQIGDERFHGAVEVAAGEGAPGKEIELALLHREAWVLFQHTTSGLRSDVQGLGQGPEHNAGGRRSRPAQHHFEQGVAKGATCVVSWCQGHGCFLAAHKDHRRSEVPPQVIAGEGLFPLGGHGPPLQ